MISKFLTEKPKTIVGVLEEVEKCLSTFHSTIQLKDRVLEFGKLLVEIYQKDLAKYKEAAKERRMDWSGYLTFTLGMSEQDGLICWGSEAVEIGEKIKLITKGGESCGEVTQYQRVEGIMSIDGRFLEKIQHKKTKVFRNESEQEIVLYEIEVEFQGNIIVRVKVGRNIDTPISEWGNFYHRPAEAVIRHELSLPITFFE